MGRLVMSPDATMQAYELGLHGTATSGNGPKWELGARFDVVPGPGEAPVYVADTTRPAPSGELNATRALGVFAVQQGRGHAGVRPSGRRYELRVLPYTFLRGIVGADVEGTR